MATAVRSAAPGLSTEDLETIRDTLAAGRKPKVMFTEAAGQIAGQLGQVVSLTDPELSDEWVVVRFGKDELPFSPADLAIPPRGAAAKKAVKAAPGEQPKEQPPPVPELLIVRERPVPTPRQEKTVSETSTVEPPVGETKPAKKAAAARGAKVKALPSLTVTLAYAEGEWTVAAQQGAKALAKPYLIKPSEALKMVGMLDVPGVQEAVEQIVASERAEAEQQAERLRSELAEIEAKLAELRGT
jgi:hypothetical protein